MDTDLTSLADDDRVALLGGTAPDRAQRRRRASLVLLMAAVAGAVTVAFVACSASVASAASSAPRSSGEGPGDESVGLSDDGTDKFWMMCGASGCGNDTHALRKWRLDPRVLALQVGSFADLPGAGPAAAMVLEHWRIHPPTFRGRTIFLNDVAQFAFRVLISDPFGTGDFVPYLGLDGAMQGKVVAVSQLQLAFIVTNVLLGNGLHGDTGLEVALRWCGEAYAPPPRRPPPEVEEDADPNETTTSTTVPTTTPGAMLSPLLQGEAPGLHLAHSLLSFLAVLSTELGVATVVTQPGSMLVAAQPGPAMGTPWRRRLGNSTLRRPTVCMEQAESCGLNDFMAGGNDFQALTDIAGGTVGGGGRLCSTASTQDESLVQFYSEVLAFSFFVSAESRMLMAPMAFLGVRRYVGDLSGQTAEGPPFYGGCGIIKDEDWLNKDIKSNTVGVSLGGRFLSMSPSSFVAVASSCAACRATNCTAEDLVNNRCDAQRDGADEDVGNWYTAFESTMYHASVGDAFRTVVKKIGTGPWGAGAWLGDSQHSFLTVWLATSLLQDVGLDYYVYSNFCENPGNQCLVLEEGACRSCLSETFRNADGRGPSKASCGRHGLRDVMERLHGGRAASLYQDLLGVADAPHSVFSSVLGAAKADAPTAHAE